MKIGEINVVAVLICAISIFKSIQTEVDLGPSTSCPGVRNVALGKYAEQSGTRDQLGPDKAVDLCTAGSDQSNKNCAQIDSTGDGRYPGKKTEGAWWYVDLGSWYQIYNVTLYNAVHPDDYWKLQDVSVKVGNYECGYFPGPASPGQVVNFTCDTSGRYVAVSRLGGEELYLLTLCEVEVWGHPYHYMEYDTGISCDYECGSCAADENLCYHVEHGKGVMVSLILAIILSLVVGVVSVYLGARCVCQLKKKHMDKSSKDLEVSEPLMSTYFRESGNDIKLPHSTDNNFQFVGDKYELQSFSYNKGDHTKVSRAEVSQQLISPADMKASTEEVVPQLFPYNSDLVEVSQESHSQSILLPACLDSFSTEDVRFGSTTPTGLYGYAADQFGNLYSSCPGSDLGFDFDSDENVDDCVTVSGCNSGV